MISADTSPVISLNDVSFAYRSIFRPWIKEKWILDQVSFDVFPGETLGVIGGNGAGKSTLMKLLAGIVKPNLGEVNLDATVQLLSLQVGFMAELSGRENCYLSGMLLGKSSSYIEANIDSVIEFSELRNVIDDPVRTYSSGMKARLGFAVSLMADPDVLLIDEAFSVGDRNFKIKSKKAIEQRMSSKRSFVLVSHSESMLSEYCKRTIWLKNGKVHLQGETSEVLDAYKKYQNMGIDNHVY